MSQQADAKVLLICPSVGVWRVNDQYCFDRKFYDGLKLYESMWGGLLKLVIRVSTEPPPQFGLVAYDTQTETIQLTVLNDNVVVSVSELQGVDVVLASADDYTQAGLSKICKEMHISCVYVIEYTLKTRLQIAMLSKVSLIRRIKTVVWLLKQELKLKNAIRISSSIQSNGVPAYYQYGSLTTNPLLFFDTRNTQDMLVKPASLSNRLSYLDEAKPLRLGFSGRLIAIKGACDLIQLAEALKKSNVNFRFDIFGAGEEGVVMQESINRAQLQGVVTLHGAVDYEKELVPFVQSALDLFICCHKQGDPSCTYLETYACGVPIAGYANEAHAGILDIANVGWAVPINDIQALTTLIAYLDKNREQIKIKANTAYEFAKKHTFEATFAARINHCKQQLEHSL